MLYQWKDPFPTKRKTQNLWSCHVPMTLLTQKEGWIHLFLQKISRIHMMMRIFEDEEDDISRPNSYHSMPETKEQTDPDIEVIHGDDGPKVKSDSDLDILVGDDTKEGNVLMASLSVEKPQQRPLSPVPPPVAKTTTTNTPPTRKTFRKAGNTSTLPLRPK